MVPSDELAGVHDPGGVERGFKRSNGSDPGGREPRQLVAFHLSDTMFGADRPPGGGDEIVDQPQQQQPEQPEQPEGGG